MAWYDLNYYLINYCSLKSERELLFNIKKFWKIKMNDLAYCNVKFDHISQENNQIIAVYSRATGL